MKRLLVGMVLLGAAVVGVVGESLAAGSCTITKTVALSRQGTKVYQLIEWLWTSDAAGDVNDSTCIVTGLSGYVLALDTMPHATTPTALYDVTVLNQYGVDIMGGKAVDRSATLAERVMPYQGVDPFVAAINGSLDLRVANAGITKRGYAALYIEE